MYYCCDLLSDESTKKNTLLELQSRQVVQKKLFIRKIFFYSGEEISPTSNKITISLSEGMGDTEVVLKPIEVKEENVYEPIYITHGMPVKLDVEKGAWYKIGVNMQNPTAEDIDVYVTVRGVEVRIESKTKGENDSNGESAEEQNSVTPQNLERPQEPDANETRSMKN